MKIKRVIGNLLLSGSIIFSSPGYSQEKESHSNIIKKAIETQVIEDIENNPSFVKNKAYSVFGGKYYLPNIDYPISSEDFQHSALQNLNMPLKKESAKNKGADETGWVPIPLSKDHIYFRAEYHVKDFDFNLEDSIKQSLEHYSELKVRKVYTDEELKTILERSKVHIVLFPMDQFELRYHPGSSLLIHENGDHLGGGLKSPRGDVKLKQEYTRVKKEDLEKLVGVFNGTYHNEDTIKIVDGKKRRAGLIVDGEIIDKPIEDIATIAFYQDGSFKIDNFNSLPDKEKIQFLRQNEYLLLHNGEIVENGAYPRIWNRYNDEILRSYIATTKDEKNFAYVWTTFCPTAIFAQAMQKIGLKELMMIDIHPVIAAILASPRNTQEDNQVTFSRESSYNFVPDEAKVINWVTRTIATKIKGPIQWDHYAAVEGGIAHDFFSISQK
ncbi:hypothetical protein HYW74_03850 [Candidatus Pacearchaeota archaeon]|nr:hypothetical protein [Candidatus Pacearchaeota archaeon]